MAKALQITAKRNGFRRAGMAHPDTAVTHPLSTLSKTQIEQLKREPMLVVHEVDMPADEAKRYKQAVEGEREPSGVPTELELIDQVNAVTDLPGLTLMRDGEQRPAVLDAIATRGAEIARTVTVPTKKAELQAWCRAHGVEYTDENTVAELTTAAQNHRDSFTRGPE